MNETVKEIQASVEGFVSSAFGTPDTSASDSRKGIDRNETADTDTGDDDMTVGTDNTTSTASLITACVGNEEVKVDITAAAAKSYQKQQKCVVSDDCNSDEEEGEEEEPDITVLAAKKYLHEYHNIQTVCDRDEDSLASSEAWMRKPIGGQNGEAIPASYVLPPEKRVESEAPQSLDNTEGIETILSNITSDELSVGTRSVNSQDPDRKEQRPRSPEMQRDLSRPLSFAPRPQSKVRKSIDQCREKLFGDKRARDKVDENGNIINPADFSPRVPLPNEVFYNAATKLWVVTLHTDQKALDRADNTTAVESMQAYSFRTESKAREAVSAMAPPRMKPFADTPTCFDCCGKFAFFRRACHCRNCGVCICKIDCSVQWPRQSLPETYNIKNENNLNICRSCHFLSNSFRDALLAGNMEKALDLYDTDNVNLRSPFAHVKGEVAYPLHCAVLGGSLELVQWLVEARRVPLSSSKKKHNSSRDGTVTTSKGRSVLDLAMACNNVDMVRYLVVDKKISVLKYKDIGSALVTLHAALRRITLLSENGAESQAGNGNEDQNINTNADDCNIVVTRVGREIDTCTTTDPKEEEEEVDKALTESMRAEEECCIICCSSKIDCVIVPCGHQICCLGCSSEISDCPICCTESTFLRTFRP